MNIAEARNIIYSSPAWGSGNDYTLVDLQGCEENDSLYFFTAFYEDKNSRRRDSVPLGVEKTTGRIINCTVDED